MDEELKKENTIEQSKQEMQDDAKGFLTSIKKYLGELFDFRHDTDHEATIEAIKNDIPFKGATAWILIFAVFVASIGLNADSTAVVIGAMLISPLMGPILGIGMSIAINDIDTLKKSITNLSTMIILSLITSFLFFWVFPLREDNSELLGRVSPDIRDVLIAFFGGLALMVAKTKKGTIASVIFGVAIATALMPPLCTAGYGLAKGNIDYFLGAMYLFTINTIFIALATFLVLKLLSFHMLKYVNSTRRKRIAQLTSFVAFLVMIPAIFTFINIYKESKIKNQIANFIKNDVKNNKDLQLIEYDVEIKDKVIKLNFFNETTDATKSFLTNDLNDIKKYPNLTDFILKIKGSDTKSFELITTAYKEKRQELKESKNIVKGLQKEIDELQNKITALNQRIELNAKAKDEKAIAFSRIAKDAKIRFGDIHQIRYANILATKDFINIDTIPQVSIAWNTNLNDSIINIKEVEFRKWLQSELKIDTLYIKQLK